jgi:hypothetical protein
MRGSVDAKANAMAGKMAWPMTNLDTISDGFGGTMKSQ